MIENAELGALFSAMQEDAVYLRPDIYALYGVLHGGGPFLGWIMDFPEGGAILYDPRERVPWISDSAEQILATHQRLGAARLEPLDR
ncbi:MAG TPA: hypothetical protein VG756_02960 [Pseudonocardiaceae bacterium]|nr:hypothetical protein [Pseudonocardiaceae bacterium]